MDSTDTSELEQSEVAKVIDEEETLIDPHIAHLILPRFRLLRGEESLVETIQFTPRSLMTVMVEETGVSKMTTVLMKDHMGQIRYKSSSGGQMHEYITRLQNSRSYGRWVMEIDGPMPDEQLMFKIEIPFFLVKKIDPNLPEPIYEPQIYSKDEVEVSIDEDVKVQFEDDEATSLLDEVIKEEIIAAAKKPPAISFHPIENDTKLISDLTIVRYVNWIDILQGPIIVNTEVPDSEVVEHTESSTTDKLTDLEIEQDGEEIHEDKGDMEEISPQRVDNIDDGIEMIDSKEEEPSINEFEELEDNKIQSEDTGEMRPNNQEGQSEQIKNEISTALPEDEVIPKQHIEEPEIAETVDTEQANIDHLEKILKEVGDTRMVAIKELFIPLDEIGEILKIDLNRLNASGIYYIEEFLKESPVSLQQILDYSQQEIEAIQAKILKIILSESHPIHQKYKKLGEIKDNSLYYSTIDVTEIYGIGKVTSEKLTAENLGMVTDLAKSDVKTIANISGFSIRKAIEFLAQANALVYQRVNLIDYDFSEMYPSDNSLDERAQLDNISNINLDELNQLYGKGINNLGKLANSNPVTLAQELNKNVHDIVAWIFEAQVLMWNRFSLQFRVTE